MGKLEPTLTERDPGQLRAPKSSGVKEENGATDGQGGMQASDPLNRGKWGVESHLPSE